MPEPQDHSAVGPALGYYFQAIYALLLMLKSTDDAAFVSVESWDDVYLEDGCQKELHQLKHSIDASIKIGLKSRELWKTMKVWADYCAKNNPTSGKFVLATVADVDPDSPLVVLSDETASRDALKHEVTFEAERVIKERIKALAEGKHQKDLPYQDRYKGCEAFLGLSSSLQSSLLKNIHHRKGVFQIHEAVDKVASAIRSTTPEELRLPLAKKIIVWWDREVVESLTGERKRCIYAEELKDYIASKTAELYTDGLSDDMAEIDVPSPATPHPILEKQLAIIDATETQKKRSLRTEMRARIQRGKWLDDNLATATKLRKFDARLVEEWSDRFEAIKEILKKNVVSEETKKEIGRELLDWSHLDAPQDVPPIKHTWNDKDLVRGSYQILSIKKSVGWHAEYDSLIEAIDDEEA